MVTEGFLPNGQPNGHSHPGIFPNGQPNGHGHPENFPNGQWSRPLGKDPMGRLDPGTTAFSGQIKFIQFLCLLYNLNADSDILQVT